MSYADQSLIYQTILDEAAGNHRVAFEIACARLATAYNGVSWAFLRRMEHDKTGGALDDAPPVDDGSWIETGKERHA